MEKSQYFDLLTSVDVLNTLHGGISEPHVVLNELEQSREMRIQVPGVSPDSIQVEINENNLFVYYVMNVDSVGKNIRLPYTIYNRVLPYFIDLSKIHSEVDHQKLVITLPYNTLTNGYHRKIKSSED
jgi:HSP20 family molecular chaperone IbpA